MSTVLGIELERTVRVSLPADDNVTECCSTGYSA